MAVGRSPRISAVAPNIVGSGLQPDLHQVQKVLWETAENVSFQNGRVRRRKPSTLLFDAGADPIRGLAQHWDSNGVRWIWAATGPQVCRWYGPPLENIYLAPDWEEDDGLLNQSTFWDFTPYGDWMVLNWGQGQARIWKPAGVAVLGDCYSDVVQYMKKANFLLAIGFGGARTRVGWSDADNIELWTPAADNAADSLTLTEFDTPIRAAAPLGESIAIFSEDQLAVLNFVGEPFWFGYKFKLDGIGCCGKKSLASDGKNLVGVGRNGVWWTDSLSFRYIDEGYLHDYLQENVNWDQQGKITVARNDVTGCFEFCFPMGVSTDPSEAWAFDPRVGGGWHEVPIFSLKDERRLFRKPVWGDLTGNIYLDMDATTANTLSLVTKPLLPQVQDETGLRDVHNNLHVQEVDLFLKEATAVEWRLGSCQTANGTFGWTGWIAAEAGAKTHLVPKPYSAGVYHKLEFRSTATNWSLDLQGFQLFGQLEGTKRSGPAS